MPPTVLVVDDDVTNISILAHLLEPEFDVVFATGGTQALEIAAAVVPDLVLLDVMMPGMDGYAVFARLKADALTAAVPVIFITGLRESDAESRGLELGAADFVTKPFNATVVRARVRNHVELKQARDRLLRLAASDGLTGLANRRAFDAALEAECRRSARQHAPLGLVMLDIDFFKAFNDRYGHVAGDDCLRRVASAIGAALHRPADVGARYGGEEFACILPETDVAGAISVAREVQAGINALAVPHAGSSVASTVSASFGVASVTCGATTSGEAIVSVADAYLYEAKLAGRNRIRADAAGALGSPPRSATAASGPERKQGTDGERCLFDAANGEIAG